jgi:pimeloyl-ACP methyl ester carboxylesterase
MVAQELAVTWPERVERLVLLCTSPGGTSASGESLASYPLQELQDLPMTERLEVGRRILDTRFTDQWLHDHPSDRFIADVYAQMTSAPRTDEQRRGERLQLEARRHHDVTTRLFAISCPTLVACGRYDGIAPPANSEAIATRVRAAELRTYEGGHAFFFQDPTALSGRPGLQRLGRCGKNGYQERSSGLERIADTLRTRGAPRCRARSLARTMP